MLYFRLNGKIIEKYDIQVDLERLKKIRLEVIYKCSKKEHVSNRGTMFWQYDDFIINFHSKPVGWVEYNDAPPEREYAYTYDQLIPPKLVSIIDGIILGKLSSIIELYETDSSKDSFDLEERINRKLEYINSIPNEEVSKKIMALNELKSLYESMKYNKDISKTDEYYKLVKQCIIFNKIGEINASISNQVLSFFDSSSINEYINNTSCDVIKLIKE